MQPQLGDDPGVDAGARSVTWRPQPSVCVVGSGTRFLSGITYYTRHLTVALNRRVDASAILMRRLIPQRFYPGRTRVGKDLSTVSYPDEIPVFDGVDWFWFPSIVRAVAFLVRRRPDVIVFQWWTGAVLHSYLVLAAAARLRRSRILIEFHEVQDTGESGLAAARWYVDRLGHVFMRLGDGYVIHSESDRAPLDARFRISRRPVATIPHGPFDHHSTSGVAPLRQAPGHTFNFLFFGTIRPYKGLDDLVPAFEELCDSAPGAYWLTVVGETWEGWTKPTELIEASRHRNRMTLVNRYVTDAEVDGYFAGADGVVLPYRRSSASGPLHVAMSAGLPVVFTSVGGLPAAAARYGGAVLVRPADAADLRRGLAELVCMRGRRFADPHSWDVSARAILDLAAETAHQPSTQG